MTQLGVIVKVQGVKGEVKIKLTIDSGIDISKLNCIYIDGINHSIISYRSNAGFAYILLNSINDRNTAQLYVNKICFIPNEQAQLKKDTMLTKDVIGCTVLLDNGDIIGTICEIVPNIHSADVYYVSTSKGVLVFPFIKKLVSKIDLASKSFVLKEQVFKEVSFYEN